MSHLPVERFYCLSDSLIADPGPTCATYTQLLLPLIVNNIVVLGTSILIGRHKFNARLKFWRTKTKDPEDYRWGPVSGLVKVTVAFVQAVVTAALIRYGGYDGGFGALVGLWLLRPRMMWGPVLWYAICGEQMKAGGTDTLFADLLLDIAMAPILVSFIIQNEKYPELCGWSGTDNYQYDWPDGMNHTYQKTLLADDQKHLISLGMGQSSEARYMTNLMIAMLSIIGLSFFVFIAFIWHGGRLRRRWASVTVIISLALFACSWLFWTSKLMVFLVRGWAYEMKD